MYAFSNVRKFRNQYFKSNPLFLGNSCYDPDDLYLFLIQSYVSYAEQHDIEQRLKENCRENGLEFHGLTPGNGDCFFEAIASQLRRIGAQQSSSVQLRHEVMEYIRQHPTYDVSICNVYLIYKYIVICV